MTKITDLYAIRKESSSIENSLVGLQWVHRLIGKGSAGGLEPFGNWILASISTYYYTLLSLLIEYSPLSPPLSLTLAFEQIRIS
jgi:hypothetical protein